MFAFTDKLELAASSREWFWYGLWNLRFLEWGEGEGIRVWRDLKKSLPKENGLDGVVICESVGMEALEKGGWVGGVGALLKTRKISQSPGWPGVKYFLITLFGYLTMYHSKLHTGTCTPIVVRPLCTKRGLLAGLLEQSSSTASAFVVHCSHLKCGGQLHTTTGTYIWEERNRPGRG